MASLLRTSLVGFNSEGLPLKGEEPVASSPQKLAFSKRRKQRSRRRYINRTERSKSDEEFFVGSPNNTIITDLKASSTTKTAIDPEHAIDQLYEEFLRRWPEHSVEKRQIGRESEFPIVDQNGEAGDARRVLHRLLEMYDFLQPVYEEMADGQDGLSKLKGDSLEFCLEVGLGVIEMVTAPCPDLHTIKTVHEAGRSMLQTACASLGYHILGYGTQPISGISAELMTPKPRYHKLVELLGEMWYTFEPTASDQAHIDVSKEEIAQVVNVTSLLTPVVVALMANSPVVSGKLTPWLSSREGMMGGIDVESGRHGMPRTAYHDLRDWFEQICRLDYLIKIDKTTKTPSAPTLHGSTAKQPFLKHLEAGEATYDDFETHEHYIWHSVRPRSLYGTVELRAACQQPLGEHMAACALSLGLVEAAAALEAWLLEHRAPSGGAGLRGWFATLSAAHPLVLKHGLRYAEAVPAAALPAALRGWDFPAFAEAVLGFADHALQARGLGEHRYLGAAWRRLRARRCPGAAALAAARRGGLKALVRHAAAATAEEEAGDEGEDLPPSSSHEDAGLLA